MFAQLRTILFPAVAPDTPDGDDRESTPLIRGLESYSDRRRKFLGRFKFLEPIAEPDPVIHVLSLFIMLWIWAISIYRAHTLTIFSFHPVFMSMGCILFMTEGVLAYRNKSCFAFAAPIMRNSARVKLQNIHRGFHILATLSIAMGIAFIFGNKVKKHRTLLPTSIHAALGFLVCLGIVIQVVIGVEKLDAQRSGVEMRAQALHKWHGKAGLVLYDIAMLTVATGIMRSLSWGLMTIVILAHLVTLWCLVHLQLSLKQKGIDALEANQRNGGGGGVKEGGVQLQPRMSAGSRVEITESNP